MLPPKSCLWHLVMLKGGLAVSPFQILLSYLAPHGTFIQVDYHLNTKVVLNISRNVDFYFFFNLWSSMFVQSLIEGQDLARSVNSSVKAGVHSG